MAIMAIGHDDPRICSLDSALSGTYHASARGLREIAEARYVMAPEVMRIFGRSLGHRVFLIHLAYCGCVFGWEITFPPNRFTEAACIEAIEAVLRDWCETIEILWEKKEERVKLAQESPTPQQKRKEYDAAQKSTALAPLLILGDPLIVSSPWTPDRARIYLALATAIRRMDPETTLLNQFAGMVSGLKARIAEATGNAHRGNIRYHLQWFVDEGILVLLPDGEAILRFVANEPKIARSH